MKITQILFLSIFYYILLAKHASEHPIPLFSPRDMPTRSSVPDSRYPGWCRHGRGYKRGAQTGTSPRVAAIQAHFLSSYGACQGWELPVGQFPWGDQAAAAPFPQSSGLAQANVPLRLLSERTAMVTSGSKGLNLNKSNVQVRKSINNMSPFFRSLYSCHPALLNFCVSLELIQSRV